jgi:hypothetical protein
MRNQFFNTHGISLGSIRYYDMPSDYSIINGSEELHQMQRQQSIKAPEGGLNVFLVSNINLDGGYSTDALGVAGGIPAPVGVNGTGGSGITMIVQSSATSTGDIIAHELGHLFGFYHVTEAQRYDGVLMHDVIADTVSCTKPPSEMWDTEACMYNIMYPYAITGMVTQSFSNTQGLIMRLNPRGR